MKKRSKKSTVLNAVLFIFVLGIAFSIGWLFITSRDESAGDLSESMVTSEEAEQTTELSAGSTPADEEWERTQQWLAENEVQTNEQRIPESTEYLEITQIYKGAGYYEVGLGGFSGEEDDLTVSWELEHPQERLNIRVSNTTSDYYPVLIKVFYNYEAVDFLVVGEDDYRHELLINLPPGYEYVIPFHLDSRLEAHAGYSMLTFAAFFDPDEYSVFHGAGHDLADTVLNFELNYGFDEPASLDLVQHPFEERSDFSANSPLITLGQPGGITVEDEYFLGPGRPRQASPGEQLEIEMLLNVRGPMTMNEFQRVDDFLIIGLLDFNQIELSGRPFLWSETASNPLFGAFTIEAPMEAGLYDFIVLIVENPTAGMTLDNFVPIDTSTRFTIEVVE